MLTWKKIERGDKIGLLGCAAIMALSAEYDEMPPANLLAAINAIRNHVGDGANVEVGSFRDDAVALIIWDTDAIAVWCLPEVRRHRLESIALGYALHQAIRAGATSIDFFADNRTIYDMAIDQGFIAFNENDLEEPLLYTVEKEVNHVYR
ncbi:hypothetical protein SH449x_000957 [Pirellulaceae bacterium SH449]